MGVRVADEAERVCHLFDALAFCDRQTLEEANLAGAAIALQGGNRGLEAPSKQETRGTI
jgi:hypothetical protein